MEIARHWRLREIRYTLPITTCTECGETHFPPRPYCLKCSQPLNGNGHHGNGHKEFTNFTDAPIIVYAAGGNGHKASK